MACIEVRPFMDGKELEQTGGEVLEVVNPATGEVVARQYCCDSEDVGRMVQSAQQAFESTAWKDIPASDRGNVLYTLASLIEKNADALTELEYLDTGKPVAVIRDRELTRVVSIFRFYAGAADKLSGEVKASSGGSFQLKIYEPYGVIGCIVPWNYPLLNLTLSVAPALAAGNAVVLKPSEETPLSSILFARLCLEAGIPPGIVNIALGDGPTAGEALAKHPGVDKLCFTGSSEIGKHVLRLAADTMKPTNLECGGKNAIIVFEDADLERAAQAVLLSAFANTGQLCVSCSRLLVQESVAPKLQSILLDKIEKIKVGDPKNTTTHLGPIITHSQYEKVMRYLNDPNPECEVIYGGGKVDMPEPYENGFWVMPTILSGVRPEMREAKEEIFGPVLSEITFTDEAEAVSFSNGVSYGLSGSVWSADSERAIRMSKALDTGVIWVNCMLAGYPQITVPPHKMSGMGSLWGMESMMACFKQKSVVLGYDSNAPVGWDL